MKGYKKFIVSFCLVLGIYFVAEYNRPKEPNWEVTLENDDKNAFGGFILYHRLNDLFPNASIQSYRLPVYNQLNDYDRSNSAYLLIGPSLELSKEDVHAMLAYVHGGNYVFMASGKFSKAIMDTLKFKTRRRFDASSGDSITVGLTNPALQLKGKYGFKRLTINGYLNKLDTSRSVVLGTNQLKDVNFIKITHGAGAIFIHALPVCFSNYFMVTQQHAAYTAAALSYVPATVRSIFWDEYYKSGLQGSDNPLRFVLGNRWLSWAFRLGLFTIVVFVLFEMKRKQRVIPEMMPLENSSLDFVRTVGNVYFNNRDNKNIALKKITYFLEYVRINLFISTSQVDNDFIESLANKSGIEREKISYLCGLIQQVQDSAVVRDYLLLELNASIDQFYERLK